MASNKAKELLKIQMEQNINDLSSFLDTHGIHPSVLAEAMHAFAMTLLDLPKEAVCKNGCAYCCHLRVGVSIPEAIVVFTELKSQTTPEGLIFLKERVTRTTAKGDTLSEAWWLQTRTPCPFLDSDEQKLCLIYAMRPFSCRAYHSTDQTFCRNGYEKGQEVQIPCFPFYRAFTDIYSTVFIRTLAQKGLFSFQVGFIRALQILFEDDMAIEKWIGGDNVFHSAKLV